MSFDWWTLGLQAINVAILVWLLHRFFWNPVAAIIARRGEDVQTILADAAEQQANAVAAVAEAATTRKGFAAEREAILAAARAVAETEKVLILQAGKDEVKALHKAASEAISAEATRAAKANIDTATTLGLSIARHLAARLKGPAIEAAFLDWMVAAIMSMPDPDRQELRRDGATVDLVSADELAPEARERVTAALHSALGGQPVLSFRTDPALIAGFELHSPHFALRNSWQDDLERIAAELRAEQMAGGQPNAR